MAEVSPTRLSPPLRARYAARMNQPLLDAARRHADAHADRFGIARIAVPGMIVRRATTPGEEEYEIQHPHLCLVIQGEMEVRIGSVTRSFGAGDMMITAADGPTVTRISGASPDAPYLSFSLHLDYALISSLLAEIELACPGRAEAPPSRCTDAEVSDAALHLIRLTDHPESVPVLQDQLIREIHYWLLTGRHGPSLRPLGYADGPSQRIARAVRTVRKNPGKPIAIDDLAAISGMSVSGFHRHFRALTSLTPLQFQKQLMLLEARRLMLFAGFQASESARAVGYESVTQFTREYAKFFGLPPAREIAAARGRAGT